MRIRLLGVAAVVAATVLTWQSPAPTADAQTAPGPTITVTPTTDLVDGQLVQVAGTGWTPQQSVRLVQCPTGVTTPTQVMQYCSERTSVVVLPDATGGFSVPMEVARQVPAGDCGTSPGRCSIVVLDLSVLAVLSPVPLTFTDGPSLSESITIQPAEVGEHGDIVTVTGQKFPPTTAVSVAQCSSLREVTDEWCAAAPITATTDATGAFTVELTVARGVMVGAGFPIDCADDCVIAAYTPGQVELATAEFQIVGSTVSVRADQSATVTPRGTVHITGDLWCSPPRGGDVDIDGTLTQVVNGRTVSAPFRASATCDDLLVSWDADVVGLGDTRFRVGPASLTVRANESVDPFPDDDTLVTVDVDLTRAAR
jgi:hypothetical protein